MGQKGVPYLHMRSDKQRPYKRFGEQLKTLRRQADESLLEVSGAVEIDESTLKEIESGKRLPDEDILLLLMNHFDVAESQALKLWEMAGYSKENPKTAQEEQLLKQIMMVIPVDNKVAYSDTAHITSNKKGVVIDFAMQGGNIQPQTISRVGMSLQQAEELTRQLISSLQNAKYTNNQRALPAPKKQNSKKNNQ